MKQKAVVRHVNATEHCTIKQLGKSVGVGISGCSNDNESIRNIGSISLIVHHNITLEVAQEDAGSDALIRLCAKHDVIQHIGSISVRCGDIMIQLVITAVEEIVLQFGLITASCPGKGSGTKAALRR